MKRDRELTELPRGVRRRMLPTARIAAKAGWRYLLRVAGRKTPVPDPAAALVAASSVVEDLGAFKGLFMKAGQMASFLPAREPDGALALLGRLQDQGTAFAYGEIAKVVEEELGAPPGELFERFDRRPVAVASIGQVHRARLDGREVAVKVQYPGIEEAIREDFAVLRPLVRLGSLGTALDLKAILAELRERIDEECDYRKEAVNQRLFARILSAVPSARVPAVIPERSGRRVLTMEFAEGLDYRRFRAAASREARNRAGEAIMRMGTESCFVRCVCNGDPQPANYVFAEDGSVTFLDFGCVRRIDPSKIALWRSLLRAVLQEEKDRARVLFGELGFIGDPRRFDWDHQWRALRHIHGGFASREAYRYTHRFMEAMYESQFYSNPNAMRMAMPADALMLNRAVYGRFALLADLGAEARWGELAREMLETPIAPVADSPGVGAARRARQALTRPGVTA